jgi:hypothetical protein
MARAWGRMLVHHIADDEQGKGTGRSRNPHWAAGVGIVAEGIGGSMLRLRVGMLRPHSVVRLRAGGVMWLKRVR